MATGITYFPVGLWYKLRARCAGRSAASVSSEYQSDFTIKIRKYDRSDEEKTKTDGNEGFAATSNQIRTTKYTILTILPLNIFEQFTTRYANIYFLMIAVLNYLPWAQTLSPEFQTLPILFVLIATFLKDAYEDYRRYKADSLINQLPAERYDFITQAYVPTTWAEILPGDIIRIDCSNPIPADCLILNTSEDDNIAYLQTSNLDGESNLKQFQAIRGFSNARDAATHTQVIQPNPDLKNIVGEIYTRIDSDADAVDDQVSLNDQRMRLSQSSAEMSRLDSDRSKSVQYTAENVLLRGCVLRNTDYAECLVIYTGADTKAMRNTKENARKTSKLEKRINKDLPWNFVFIVVLNIIVSIFAAVDNQKIVNMLPASGLWYSNPQNYSSATIGGITFVTFLILIQTLIPIAIYVSWEIVKLGQVYFINQDINLYDKTKDISIHCNALNITEDLGQIEYIFSDKTGTLTENIMLFKTCVVGGKQYHKKNLKYKSSVVSRYRKNMSKASKSYIKSKGGEANMGFSIGESQGFREIFKSGNIHQGPDDGPKSPAKSPTSPTSRSVDLVADKELQDVFESNLDYFLCILLCHSALCSKDDSSQYETESADELALLEFVQAYGCKMVSRTNTQIVLEINGTSHVYSILHFVKFESRRKRMSIVVQNKATNEITLFIKGADDTILELSTRGHRKDTKKNIDKFASSGLRTLCLAKRSVSKADYDDWATNVYDKAFRSLDPANIEAAYDVLESQDISLLGGTGIEDKLQDKVPETIKFIRESGVKIWVITGDKMETAINIGYSSQLLTRADGLIILKSNITDPEIHEILSRKYSQDDLESSSLVVEGSTLFRILANDDWREAFVDISKFSRTVIICRATPKLKGEVVILMRESLGVQTLAIGDGANDVAMIQSASIGIGIVGNEGMQAAMNADFAIPKFSMLKRLLYVHGHWCYQRAANMLLYFIKKHMSIGFVQVFFQIYARFYTSNPIEDMMFLLPNVIFNSLPPIVGAIFDQSFDAFTLESRPQLYQYGMQSKAYKSSLAFFTAGLYGIFVATVTFWIGFARFWGSPDWMYALGWWWMVVILTNHWLVWVIDMSIMTTVHFLSLAGTILVFIVFTSAYVHIDTVDAFLVNSLGMGENVFQTWWFWWDWLLAVTLTIIPYLLAKVFMQDRQMLQAKIDGKKQRPVSTSWFSRLCC